MTSIRKASGAAVPSNFPPLSLSSFSLSSHGNTPAACQPSAVDRWHESAASDYRLARLFADRFGARLDRAERSQRAGWDRDGRSVYGILLPDPLPSLNSIADDWYVYYVWGETLFHRTRAAREKLRMLVLPDGVEDWAELLRQALRDEVFHVRYDVRPHFMNALGDVETAPCGYEFTLSACAPETASVSDFQLAGTGETPEAAAREACIRWLKARLPDIAPALEVP